MGKLEGARHITLNKWILRKMNICIQPRDIYDCS